MGGRRWLNSWNLAKSCFLLLLLMQFLSIVSHILVMIYSWSPIMRCNRFYLAISDIIFCRISRPYLLFKIIAKLALRWLSNIIRVGCILWWSMMKMMMMMMIILLIRFKSVVCTSNILLRLLWFLNIRRGLVLHSMTREYISLLG